MDSTKIGDREEAVQHKNWDEKVGSIMTSYDEIRLKTSVPVNDKNRTELEKLVIPKAYHHLQDEVII